MLDGALPYERGRVAYRDFGGDGPDVLHGGRVRTHPSSTTAGRAAQPRPGIET